MSDKIRVELTEAERECIGLYQQRLEQLREKSPEVREFLLLQEVQRNALMVVLRNAGQPANINFTLMPDGMALEAQGAPALSIVEAVVEAVPTSAEEGRVNGGLPDHVS